MTQASERTATLSALVAEEIRALMARRRISGRQLATQLEVSPSWVSYRLTGTQPIDVNDLALIADALGVGVHDLLPPPEVAATALKKNLAPPQVQPRKHVARSSGGRPTGHPRTDSVRPTSAVPLNRRRPVSTRPANRPMAS
jgi:transcriptional regulator with XRE-family HTH domain